MPKTSIGGIIGPVTTPFDASGDALDLAGFTANIEAHLESGLSGIVVTGSTGEAALLTESERTALLDAARGVIPRDRWMIAGIGAESTKLTVERARTAASIGADAALVVAPHYYPQSASAEALTAHYTRIADESPIPVMLYNIPQYMHFNIPAPAVRELAAHRNIIGMKDSGGDLGILAGFLSAQSPSFAVLTGSGSSLQGALTAGVRGGILAVALFAPATVTALVEALHGGRAAEAEAAQAQLITLSREIVAAMGPAGVKAALDAIGLRGGTVRSPLRPLNAVQQARVRELVEGAAIAGAGA